MGMVDKMELKNRHRSFFSQSIVETRAFKETSLIFSYRKMMIVNDMYKDVTGNDLLHSIDYKEWKTIHRVWGRDFIESHWRHLVGVFAETMATNGVSY
jgi:hypothetical protein